MKAVVIGCGRVGSAVAIQLAGEGWDVTCVDEDEEALKRLGNWGGGFVVSHGARAQLRHRGRKRGRRYDDQRQRNVVISGSRRYSIGCVVVRCSTASQVLHEETGSSAGRQRSRS
jgi:2-polyprenyl-6-methoxyphenol hydroxylase-like FAD-dependent oxidoreductase